jgi:hypothetical protein
MTAIAVLEISALGQMQRRRLCIGITVSPLSLI